MYATIMVPGLGDGSDDAALNMAILFGKTFDAHVGFVRVHRQVGAGVRDVGAFLPEGNLGDAYVKLVQDTDARLSEVAQASFRKALERSKAVESPDPEARGELSFWINDTRSAASAVEDARYHDLVVTAAGPESVASDLIMGAGRPVVLAPAKTPASITRTVAIAWKPTAEAARAVGAAMPLLRKAERVVVIAANESEGAERTLKAANGLTNQLAWHGVAAEPHAILSEVRGAESVLGAAHDAGADIMVMGAYSRSRAREYVFGGFTHHVLHNETLPVFLFH